MSGEAPDVRRDVLAAGTQAVLDIFAPLLDDRGRGVAADEVRRALDAVLEAWEAFRPARPLPPPSDN